MFRAPSDVADFGVSMRKDDKREVKPMFYAKGEMFRDIDESKTHDVQFDCR